MSNGMELRRPGNRSPVHQVHEPGSQQDGKRQDRLREEEECSNVDKQKYQEVMDHVVYSLQPHFNSDAHHVFHLRPRIRVRLRA